MLDEKWIFRASVLFLSTEHSARSQMAEGFLRHYAGNQNGERIRKQFLKAALVREDD
jgi:hypothetical protein